MDQEDEIDPRYELRLGAGRPLPEAIADKIREFVDNGTFKPGTKLPNESELARNMRVARSSVRTALQRLEAHGVCDVKRGVGWYVRQGSLRRLLQGGNGVGTVTPGTTGSTRLDGMVDENAIDVAPLGTVSSNAQIGCVPLGAAIVTRMRDPVRYAWPW